MLHPTETRDNLILMADKTTKLLLAVIALGVWANLVILFRPARSVSSSAEVLSSIDIHLSEIEESTKAVDQLKEDIDTLKDDVSAIAVGGCANGSLCR